MPGGPSLSPSLTMDPVSTSTPLRRMLRIFIGSIAATETRWCAAIRRRPGVLADGPRRTNGILLDDTIRITFQEFISFNNTSDLTNLAPSPTSAYEQW